jgi:hypothetical protein
VSEPQEPSDEARKDDEAQKETAQGEGLPEAPEDLPPPAPGHGTASKEPAQNPAATQTSVTDRLRAFFRRK